MFHRRWAFESGFQYPEVDNLNEFVDESSETHMAQRAYGEGDLISR
jgi:hypothetical protein